MHLLPPQQQPSPLPRARWWWRPECIGSQRRTSCQGRRNRHILRKRVKLGGVWRSISCAFRHCDSSESHLDSVLNSLSFIRCLPIFAGTDLSLVKQAAGSSASSVFAQLQTLNLRLQTSVLCECARTDGATAGYRQKCMNSLAVSTDGNIGDNSEICCSVTLFCLPYYLPPPHNECLGLHSLF